jgi:hypothetical protein
MPTARTPLHVLLSALMHMCVHLPLMLHPTPVPLFFGGASCSTIKAIIEGPPFQLLEAAAEAVSAALLAHDRRVGAVQVQLLKPHVAVPGVVDALGEWRGGAGWVCWRGWVGGCAGGGRGGGGGTRQCAQQQYPNMKQVNAVQR